MAGTPDFNKRAVRVDIRQPAVLINSDGVELNVVVLDISSAGFRLNVEENLKIGELVALRVERHEELAAQIRWTLGSEAGGVFTGSVDHARLG